MTDREAAEAALKNIPYKKAGEESPA